MSPPLRDASLLELFRLEAEAQTRALSDGLLTLERDPVQPQALEACMRAAHSLKGAARIVGLDDGVRIAHVMEDCLVAAQAGRLRLHPDDIDALLCGADLLQRLAEPPSAQAAAVGEAEVTAFVHRLENLMRVRPGTASTAPSPPVQTQQGAPLPHDALDGHGQTTVTEPADEEADAVAARDVVPAAATPQAPERWTGDGGERALRVTADHLNRLLDLSSKSLVESQRFKPLVDSATRLKRLHAGVAVLIGETQQQLGDMARDTPLHALMGALARLADECRQGLAQHTLELDECGWHARQRAQLLYDTALACRMRPFADVLVGQARMVRDLGRQLGKRVRLVVSGERTQVDRDVLEQLEAPLAHLLRNAIDHGIEMPERRLALGKAEEGTINLRVRHQAGLLLLELSDDGAGVDFEVLRACVVERQLVAADMAPRLSAEELLAFLFLPGFSLRKQVTEISGRGVGLDAVQHTVRALRGNMRLEAQPGSGARFSLQVPLTLSVVRSLVVQVGGEAYAFPLAHIERMLMLSPDDIDLLQGRQHFWHDGRHVGLVAASQILQCAPEGDGASIPVVVVRDNDMPYGITVERFLGEHTLNVMPLDARLGKIADVAAGALLDDGRPVLILDVEDMLRSIEKLLDTGTVGRIDAPARRADQRARKRVLVVDDSLTVRELQRKLLQHRGYDVAVAVDGMDGWHALRSSHFDLLISDIDMPRMDGIELVTLVRRDKRLQSLPVMVVSYKDREEDRRRGLDAGADYYLAKASFHDEALLDAVVTLIGEA